MATGVGLAVGFSMMLFTKSRRGWPMTSMALLFSIVGVLFGKYIADYHHLSSDDGFFSAEVFDHFLTNVDTSLDGASGVWIFLALVAAWKMTSRLGIKVPK